MADDIKHILERESKWQKRWKEARAFVPKNDGSKPKYYNLIDKNLVSSFKKRTASFANERMCLDDWYYNYLSSR